MKFTALLFVSFLLFSLTFASKLEAMKSAKFAKSKLGKFIINFAQALSSQDTTVDYSPLWSALDTLVQSLEDQQTSADAANQAAQVIHNNLISNYQANADSANSDIVATNQQLNDLAADQTSYQNQIANDQAAIDSANQQISDLNSARSDRVDTYNQNVEDANSAISSIDQALQLLRSLQVSSDTSSFLQLNEKAFKETKAKLQKSLDQMGSRKKTNYRYKPLLLAVVEILSSQNFVNQDALTNVINLLVDLEGTVNDYLTKLNNDEQNAEDNYNTQLSGLNNATDLATQDQENAQSNLDNTNANIANSQAFLAQRTSDLATANDNISNENDLWNQKVQAYNNLTTEINNEISVVEQAEQALTAGGITRPTD